MSNIFLFRKIILNSMSHCGLAPQFLCKEMSCQARHDGVEQTDSNSFVSLSLRPSNDFIEGRQSIDVRQIDTAWIATRKTNEVQFPA